MSENSRGRTMLRPYRVVGEESNLSGLPYLDLEFVLEGV